MQGLHRPGRFDRAPSYRAAAVTDPVYQQLLPIVRHCLEVAIENDFEESVVAVTMSVMEYRWSDNSSITQWITHPGSGQATDVILRGRILEVFAHWVHRKTQEMDAMVFPCQAGQLMLSARVQDCKTRLEQACLRVAFMEALAEFIFHAVVEILGTPAQCLASFLAGVLVAQANRHDLLCMCEWPSALLSTMVCELESLQAKICKIVMELYHDSGFQTYDESKNALMMFFPFYTVETTTGTLEVHEAPAEEAFVDSPFRVNLIDSFGQLMKVLRRLEFLCQGGSNGHKVILAVDFEGVKLCRHGALCLVQMTCSDDPTLVYVLDVYVLGRRAFTMATTAGTSMKGLLEDESIRKVWFDPRNDVDALYHQFGIVPKGIFDLQLAEVADRRNRGLSVSYVQGLYKCLTQCTSLAAEQKVFAEKINALGKSLFEPQNGGNYEIFQARPLNPVILVYAAHDSRYMLLLYEQYLSQIGQRWVPRVLRAGDARARLCFNPNYLAPNSDAPEF